VRGGGSGEGERREGRRATKVEGRYGKVEAGSNRSKEEGNEGERREREERREEEGGKANDGGGMEREDGEE
jgi:hypothetical protein